VRRVVLIVLIAFVVAAPASAERRSGAVYSARDLPRILDPAPTIPGWAFEEGDPYIYPIPRHAPAFTLREWNGESPTGAQKALAAKLTKAGFVIGRHKVWEADSPQSRGSYDAAAVVFAFLFRTVPGARVGFRTLLPPNTQGVTRLSTRGLGEQALGSHSRSGDEGAYYFWRRANLVTFAFIQCDGDCDFPAVSPARAYAYEIDARAKQS
jgi:hypothetical protein